MASRSAFSASNTTEQAGSMMSSRKTICTGKSARGHFRSTGTNERPAMGMCTEKMYSMALLKLS